MMTQMQLTWAINEMNASYARCIDSDALEAWPDFFQEQCLYNITSRDNHERGFPAGIFYAASKGMLKDRISALRQANIFERHRYRHLLGMAALLEVTAHSARAETPFAVYRVMLNGSTTLFATGRYLDRLALEPQGALKLIERVVVCDSSVIDTLLVIPL
jgi:3-phenylpropionate/cinnamic acid dioxygenase small subunit